MRVRVGGDGHGGSCCLAVSVGREVACCCDIYQQLSVPIDKIGFDQGIHRDESVLIEMVVRDAIGIDRLATRKVPKRHLGREVRRKSSGLVDSRPVSQCQQGALVWRSVNDDVRDHP